MTKEAMIKFINSFDKYPTMNSWNGLYGYSINMKIHNLPLRTHEKDKLYNIIGDECLSENFYEYLNDDIENWKYDNKELFGTHTERQELRVNIGGLSPKELKARIEAYQKPESIWKYDRHGTEIMTCWRIKEVPNFDAGFNGRSGGHLVLYKWNGHNFHGANWVHDEEDLKTMNKEEVREVYLVLKAFEKLSKMLIETAKSFSHEEIEDEEYTITKTRKRFKNIS